MSLSITVSMLRVGAERFHVYVCKVVFGRFMLNFDFLFRHFITDILQPSGKKSTFKFFLLFKIAICLIV